MSNIIVSPTSGVIEFNTGDASGASFYTSTAPIRLDSTGGNTWFNSGVGIGVTNPDATLEIQNGTTSASVYGINMNDMFKVRSDGVIYWGSAFSYGLLSWTTNKAIVGGLGGRDLGLYAASAEKMTIKTDGKVGIGTNNPLYKLDVSGTIAGTSGNFVSGITIGGNPVMTGTSDTDVDTLQTVTDRGNVTTTSISSLGQYISGGSGVFTRADIGSVDIFGDAVYVGEVRTNSLSDKVSNGNAQINFGGASKTIEFETAATARMFPTGMANGHGGLSG